MNTCSYAFRVVLKERSDGVSYEVDGDFAQDGQVACGSPVPASPLLYHRRSGRNSSFSNTSKEPQKRALA
jgi:hypothetical protein